jgi:hypothetical protein
VLIAIGPLGASVAYCHVAVSATIYLALCSFVANDDFLCVRIRSGKKNSARFSRQMLANEVERFKPPQYVAFRTMERWVVIPVIARIESREGGRLYGYWFSRFTPEGTLREVPVDYVVELGNDDDPEKLIDLLRGGRDLPVEFVQRLHVID